MTNSLKKVLFLSIFLILPSCDFITRVDMSGFISPQKNPKNKHYPADNYAIREEKARQALVNKDAINNQLLEDNSPEFDNLYNHYQKPDVKKSTHKQKHKKHAERRLPADNEVLILASNDFIMQSKGFSKIEEIIDMNDHVDYRPEIKDTSEALKITDTDPIQEIPNEKLIVKPSNVKLNAKNIRIAYGYEKDNSLMILPNEITKTSIRRRKNLQTPIDNLISIAMKSNNSASNSHKLVSENFFNALNSGDRFSK